MAEILHDRLPFTPWADPALRRLPGMMPTDPGMAFQIDEAYAAQMAERDRLIDAVPESVIACHPEAEDAAGELLEMACACAGSRGGFDVGQNAVRRPDGIWISRDSATPLMTIGRLFQADYCLLQKPPGESEHVLTAAVLCFPASWTLAEKIGRPLYRIHRPVEPYDQDLARRVQRLFDGLHTGRALWRANALLYARADLFQPGREQDARPKTDRADYLRSERQVLFRLPRTGAVVFSIHTFVLSVDRLDPAQADSLANAKLGKPVS